MKVIYTGRHDGLSPAQQKKLQSRLARLGKWLDRREEKEAHVFLTSERHLHRAEITVNYYNHPLVGIESSAELFAALTGAVEKIEKQLLKLRAKFRETRRGLKASRRTPAAATAAGPAPIVEIQSPPRVIRVNNRQAHKPMTVDEAVLEMDNDRDYVVYRDAQTDHMSVLLRRRDGHFDLIEP